MSNIWENILTAEQKQNIIILKGPVFIIGASGFIGANLFHCLNTFRDDVFACSRDIQKSWRLKGSDASKLINVDITDFEKLKDIINKYSPATIYNLAAYGAYSKQQEYKKIYDINITANISVLEILKNKGFDAYIHAGSSSEYGLNSNAPKEDDELIPNSHYAISKASFYHVLKYYGVMEKLPVMNLRLYSVYGPWEEPDRLIPVLIYNARHKTLPPFVHPEISRDFIYISDVITAFIYAAISIKPELYGRAYNIGTGVKTTIKELAEKTINVFNLDVKPVFGSMEDRKWDLPDWYANINNAVKDFNWKPSVKLEQGLLKTSDWQNAVDFDNALWNFIPRIK